MQLITEVLVSPFMCKSAEENIRLLKSVGKTFKMMSMTIADEMERSGMRITQAQGMLLRRLSIQDGPIQNDLAWITFRDKTSLARLITKMEKNGYVTRKKDSSDGRAKRVFITEKGRELAASINEVLSAMAKRFSHGIDPDDLAVMMHTLESIQKNLDNDFEL
ncbi:MAG TPA: MarR family transcriptional regulator [Saprospiraceae bacterium]|nr:MarR family transcriptional regulator [Saprospiraceae bacterium]